MKEIFKSVISSVIEFYCSPEDSLHEWYKNREKNKGKLPRVVRLGISLFTRNESGQQRFLPSPLKIRTRVHVSLCGFGHHQVHGGKVARGWRGFE